MGRGEEQALSAVQLKPRSNRQVNQASDNSEREIGIIFHVSYISQATLLLLTSSIFKERERRKGPGASSTRARAYLISFTSDYIVRCTDQISKIFFFDLGNGL